MKEKIRFRKFQHSRITEVIRNGFVIAQYWKETAIPNAPRHWRLVAAGSFGLDVLGMFGREFAITAPSEKKLRKEIRRRIVEFNRVKNW